MRQFRHIFAILFVAATLISALHEVIHNHHYDMNSHVEENCPLYLLAHTPIVLNDDIILPTIITAFESFSLPKTPEGSVNLILTKSRSPPIS